MSSASAQWRPAAPHDRRIARTARGLRVFALLVAFGLLLIAADIINPLSLTH